MSRENTPKVTINLKKESAYPLNMAALDSDRHRYEKKIQDSIRLDVCFFVQLKRCCPKK